AICRGNSAAESTAPQAHSPRRDIAVLRGRLHSPPYKVRIIDVAARRPAQKAPPGRGLSRDETWDRQNPRGASLQRRVSELGRCRPMSASVPTAAMELH